MKSLVAVIKLMLAGRGIDRHAADGVARSCVAVGMMVAMAVAGMIVSPAAATGLRFAHRTFPISTCNLYPVGVYRRDAKRHQGFLSKAPEPIEGQVRGLSKMVDEDRYCIDIVTQISAVRAALRRVEEEVLRDHVSHCVEHAITSGNKADQREKIAELMAVIGRSDR